MKKGLVGASGAALMVGLPVAAFAQQRPNIIYIMTDQQQATAMSCAGNGDLHTPAMDRLAEHGVRFTNAYCSFPLSGPSRSCMFTGLMPSEMGIVDNGYALPDSVHTKTLGTILGEGGYECVYAGKWHANKISLSEGEFGFHVIKKSGDKGLAEACVDWLQTKSSSDPFFLVASFVNPHNICEYSREESLLPDTDVSVDLDTTQAYYPNLPANYAIQPFDASILQYEKREKTPYPANLYYDADDWRRYRYAYFRLVEAVDAEIGKIVDEIDRQDLWKNTVIVFTSDHGEGAGSHQWYHKLALYEEVANIPLIICLPGGKNAGTVSDALVNNGIDLMPSFCDWAGVEVPAGRKGTSFRPVAETGSKGSDYVVCETNFPNHSQTVGWMVRTEQYKYVLYGKGKNREQLYDMTVDRGENCNLAIEARYADVVKEHRALLKAFLSEHKGPASKQYVKYLKDEY